MLAQVTQDKARADSSDLLFSAFDSDPWHSRRGEIECSEPHPPTFGRSPPPAVAPLPFQVRLSSPPDAVGSGPRYQILSHVFAHCASQKNTRTCENRTRFNVQKSVTRIIFFGPLPTGRPSTCYPSHDPSLSPPLTTLATVNALGPTATCSHSSTCGPVNFLDLDAR